MPKRKARSILWTSLIAVSAFMLFGCNASSTFKTSPPLQSNIGSAVKLEGVPFPLPPELAKLNPQIPPDSPLTEERIALGEKLFSDTRLSRDQSMSCMGCHQPALSFTAPIVTGRLRNPPVIFNRLFSSHQFWNRRASSLEDQIAKTMEEPVEMNFPGKEAVARLNRDRKLVAEFASVFGNKEIREADLYRALASYVRSIVSSNSKFDRYTAGNLAELNEIELQGKQLFFEKLKCATCHSGPNFTNEILSPPCYPQFGQQIGKKSKSPRKFNQEFKTPSLRNLGASAPYFHNGSLDTIEQTIEFYDKSGPPPLDFINAELFQVPINNISKSDVQALRAFLNTLNGDLEYGHPRKKIRYQEPTSGSAGL